MFSTSSIAVRLGNVTLQFFVYLCAFNTLFWYLESFYGLILRLQSQTLIICCN
jgi:hypothetical protein